MSGIVRDGWFSERDTFWPGQALSIKVDEILYDKKSNFQDILVFRSNRFGTVLVLDGVVQCTELDECSYQEMISHVPLFSHPNPRKVLVIGGGDGGVIREVVKHPEVEEVIQCEIDEDVIQVSKKFLPSMAVGYSSSKLVQHIGDGLAFMKEQRGQFDVIITDSSDPVGECYWLHLPLIKDMLQFSRGLFPVVNYCSTTVATYPCGQIGFLLCSNNSVTQFEKPLRHLSDPKSMNLKWYSPEMHMKSFVMPQFVKEALLM
ncbi:spermidine synthase-like isoform X2 [Corticium candelabrum]|uniref:spermidine synthase-like isoform X2 n=1 Tax=Corticium candelabrum TaxID=121492 RepID=UPI002E270748|nr:spermidine synthase-like isoform X2 [Corticium candelabrum]